MVLTLSGTQQHKSYYYTKKSLGEHWQSHHVHVNPYWPHRKNWFNMHNNGTMSLYHITSCGKVSAQRDRGIVNPTLQHRPLTCFRDSSMTMATLAKLRHSSLSWMSLSSMTAASLLRSLQRGSAIRACTSECTLPVAASCSIRMCHRRGRVRIESCA